MTLSIRIVRTQHAVGHGGFHTGVITSAKMDDGHNVSPSSGSSYVYDCGSDNRSLLTSAIGGYAQVRPNGTDVLFVSHLHSDHLSGIDQLTAAASPHTVIIPYLSKAALLHWLVRDLQNGSLSSLAIQYAGDPQRWWRDRGVRNLIFLTGEGPDGEGEPRPPRPEVGGGLPEGGRELFDGEGVLLRAEIMLPDQGVAIDVEEEFETGPMVFNLRETGAFRTIVGGTGSTLCIVEHSGAGTMPVLDWILLPYVHDVGRDACSAFQVDAAAALGWALPVRPADLLKALTDLNLRAVLRNAYKQHFGSDHNRVSMSLFSGPCRPNQNHIYMKFGWWPLSPTGWLKTGDAPLAESRYRKPFLRFYASLMDKVGCLSLPHHGSALNFHDELVAGKALNVAIVTTEPSRNRVASVAGTIASVQAHGCAVHVVDADPRNVFHTIDWV